MKTEAATTTHDGASDVPWSSLTPSAALANSAWPDFRPAAAAKTNALTLQLKATNAFKESLNSDDDSCEDSDEDDVDYWPDPGAERFHLFRRIFVEDGELRRYFEDNHKAGEFFCFVCGGIGKKSSGRSFKSCQGLLQHVAAMSKVERSQSHRAFGLVVCKVLGWDFDQIPLVVLKGEPLCRTLGEDASVEKQEIVSGDVKENVEVPSDNGGSLIGNGSSLGKGESVGDVVALSMKVVCDDKTVVKEVFESNIQTGDDKGRVVSKGGLISRDVKKGLSVVGGSETKSTIQPCSGGKARSGNQAKEEKASKDSENEEESEDGDEEEEDEKDEEDPSENENGDTEEDPDEDPNEVQEEDPNEDEEEDPSEEGSEEEEEEDEEEEDPSENEDRDGNDNKDKNKGRANNSKHSTMSKSCLLDQPMAQLGITQPLGSSSEWPFGEAVVKNPSANVGWHALTPKLAIPLSPEEQAMLASDNVQRKAIKLCKDFLRTRSRLDSLDDHNEEKDEEDSSEGTESESEDEDAPGNSKELNFFSKLFSEDVKLRDFYANDHGSREYCCLVCSGVGKKDWKRFTSVALVQHSTAISRTRKKRAHRAYGEVVCGVLGWDKNRLPSIVMRSESHAQDQPWMKLNAICSVEKAI